MKYKVCLKYLVYECRKILSPFFQENFVTKTTIKVILLGSHRNVLSWHLLTQSH